MKGTWTLSPALPLVEAGLLYLERLRVTGLRLAFMFLESKCLTIQWCTVQELSKVPCK